MEFPTLLEEEWQVPLELAVDFKSAVQISGSAEVNAPGAGLTGPVPAEPEGSVDPGAVKPGPGDPGSAEADAAEPGTAGSGSTEQGIAESPAPETKTVSVTRLKPGTYTVTANIFLSKEDTGLPLNPHLTSGIFPPKDPVSDNATLIVAADGTAKTIVPVPVTVMSLNAVKGLDIIDMEKDDSGAIKSLTLNLGRLDNPKKLMSKGLNVSITLSDLAQSISGFEPDHNWPAKFELDLSGVPTVQVETTVNAINPKTGDDASFAGYLVLMLVSLAGIGFLTFRRRRHAAS